MLLIHSGSGSGYDRVITDREGKFSSRALAGPISVSLRADLTRPADWYVAPHTLVNVVVPQQSDAFEIPVIEAVRNLREKGRLIDQDGNPIAEAGVNPRPRNESEHVTTIGPTKSNGEFEFIRLETVEIDHYSVTISDFVDPQNQFLVPAKSVIAKVESEKPLVLRVERPSPTFEGPK